MIRIYQNGNLMNEYITLTGDGVNDGIHFSTTEGEKLQI